MYKRLLTYKKMYFEATVYHGEQNYFVVFREDNAMWYAFLDLELKKMYPADTFIKKLGFVYEDHLIKNTLNYEFGFDFEKNGFSECPLWLKQLILGEEVIFKQDIMKEEKLKFIFMLFMAAIPVIAVYFIVLFTNDDMNLFFTMSLFYFPIFLAMILLALKDLEWALVYSDRIEVRNVWGLKNSVSFSDIAFVEVVKIPLFTRDEGKEFYIFNDGRRNNRSVFGVNSCYNKNKFNLRVYKSPKLEDYITNTISLKIQ